MQFLGGMRENCRQSEISGHIRAELVLRFYLQHLSELWQTSRIFRNSLGMKDVTCDWILTKRQGYKLNPLSHCKVCNSCGLESKAIQGFPVTAATLVRGNELFQGYYAENACSLLDSSADMIIPNPREPSPHLTLAQTSLVITFHLEQSQGKLQIQPFPVLILAFPLVLLYHMIM